MTAPVFDGAARTRPLLLALYAVAAALLLPSLMEFMLVSFPYRVGAAQWRFGAVGLLFNSVLASPIIAFAVAAFAAVQLGHRTMARVIAIVAFVLAALLVIAGPFFVLDFLQLRSQVNPQMKRAFDLTTLKATLTGMLMFVTIVSIGIGAWKSGGPGAPNKAKARGAVKPAQGPVVMGASPQG